MENQGNQDNQDNPMSARLCTLCAFDGWSQRVPVDVLNSGGGLDATTDGDACARVFGVTSDTVTDGGCQMRFETRTLVGVPGMEEPVDGSASRRRQHALRCQWPSSRTYEQAREGRPHRFCIEQLT